jgi:hypothetical protein
MVHEALPEDDPDETWLLNRYGLAVHMHAYIASMTEEFDDPDCGYPSHHSQT